jgi:hypothetical protein
MYRLRGHGSCLQRAAHLLVGPITLVAVTAVAGCGSLTTAPATVPLATPAGDITHRSRDVDVAVTYPANWLRVDCPATPTEPARVTLAPPVPQYPTACPDNVETESPLPITISSFVGSYPSKLPVTLTACGAKITSSTPVMINGVKGMRLANSEGNPNLPCDGQETEAASFSYVVYTFSDGKRTWWAQLTHVQSRQILTADFDRIVSSLHFG